jgi:putative flippase GtrA
MFKRLVFNRQMQLRFLKFFIVGGLGYSIALASFNCFKLVLNPNIAFTASFLLSLVTHYSLNRFWALKSIRNDTCRQLLEYLATAAIGYIISFSSFKILNMELGLSLSWSQALSQPPATIVTFFILNFWVFKHSTEEKKLFKK